MAEIVCYSTKPNPCHYTTLLNADVLNFCLTLDLLQSDCSDVVSKWRGHTVAVTFLLRSHCQTFACCLETIFLCFNRTAPRRIEHATPLLSWRERDARNASSSISACVRVQGTFRAQILTILSHLSWQLITLLNKPYFSLLCANSVVR